MVDWVVTDMSNGMDRRVRYQSVLGEIRQFVANHDVGTIEINLQRRDGGQQRTTSLTMTANNFTVTHINGNQINYQYGNLPEFHGFDLDVNNQNSLPTGGAPASQQQKAKLIYMFAEAARSAPIEMAFANAIEGMGSVDLRDWSVPVHVYGHVCTTVNLDPAGPVRPLTGDDYRAYAITLADGTPDRVALLQRFQG